MTKKNGFGRKGWMIIIFVLFIYLCTSVVPDTLNVSVTEFSITYGWNSNQMLIFSAIGGFVGVVVAMLFGGVVAKKGVKWPTAVFLILFAVLWLIYGNARSIIAYGLAVVFATAVANTLNLVSTQQIMNNWFPRKKGIALGWSTIGTCLSSAVMVAVFQKMFNISIRVPFYLMMAGTLLLALINIIWFKNYPEEAGAFPDNEPITEEEKKKNLVILNGSNTEFSLGKLMKTKEMWMLALIFGFIALGLVAAVSQMVPRLIAVGISQNQAILWLTIASVIGIPASVIWGIIDQKIGTNKTVKLFSMLWTIMMLVSAIGSGLANIPIASFSVVFYAVLLGGMMNLMPSAIISVFGRYDFAQANKLIMPIVIGVRSCAFLIIPIMLTLSGTNINNGYRNAFLLCTILSAVATVLAFTLKDRCIGRMGGENDGK